jgi:hypothetical protein
MPKEISSMTLRHLTIVLLAFAAGCDGWGPIAGSPVHRKEKHLIVAYGNHLWDAIRRKDPDAFMSLRYSIDDLGENINSGAAIPWTKEDIYLPATREQLAAQFTDMMKQLETRLGDFSQGQCTRIAYFIEEDKYTLELGAFQFDLTLKLEANRRTAYIYQGPIYLSVHGLRWVAPPHVTNDAQTL